ncbi:MAG: tyrosine-type recombinase/integrase [Tepidimonas ignava]|nr:tyrosine-type recombinase/integrase [Tepidimonas ignava]
MAGKLTARHVDTLGDGSHADGGNLYLRVRGASRAWVFRFKRDGQVRELGLGPTSARPLKEARELAAQLRNALLNGQDPAERLATLTGRNAAESTIPTFQEAAQAMIQAKQAGWRNPKHAQQWANTLRDYALPVIGHLRPADVTLAHVKAILQPIWADKTETATRVRQRIEAVLDYCAVHGWRTGENPARWRGTLDKVLPPPAKLKNAQHFAAAGADDVPAIMAELAKQEGVAALVLRFTILTAARSGEARGAMWGEIDLEARLWTVPAERMKAGRPHRVPLSDEAIEVLKVAAGIRRKTVDLVFPSPRDRVLTDVGVSKVLKSLRPGLTVHGFRSTFRDWAAERTRYPARVAELCLAHQNKDKVEAAYQRSDLLEQRRQLMAEWGRWCCPKPAQVVNLPGRRGRKG